MLTSSDRLTVLLVLSTQESRALQLVVVKIEKGRRVLGPALYTSKTTRLETMREDEVTLVVVGKKTDVGIVWCYYLFRFKV